jgi:hypothetical protein
MRNLMIALLLLTSCASYSNKAMIPADLKQECPKEPEFKGKTKHDAVIALAYMKQQYRLCAAQVKALIETK